MRTPTFFTALTLLLATGGCMRAGSAEHFNSPDNGGIKRAAYELECPVENLSVTELASRTVGVAGCNKKAIYVFSYGGWVNNSASDDDAHPRAQREK